MKRSLTNEDRISQLPEPLLVQILSSLPTIDVVSTSLLSKQWKSLWKLMPKLDFDHHYIESEDETFSEIVCRVLLSNQAPVLESLDISFSLDDCDEMDLGMWIGMAYPRGVRKLLISVVPDSEEGYRFFKFPKSLYDCETLETLEVNGWVLIDVPSQASLNSLRTLCLRSVKFEDEESFHNLFSGCPNLENLEVHRYDPDDEMFTITSPSLQRLTIYDENYPQSYEINAPSLKYLKIEECKGLESVLIENAPELVEAHILNVSKITNENILGSVASVKRLSLALSPLEITFPNGIIFNRLVNLELSTHKAEWWNLLLLMLDSSPKLQVLKLTDSRRILCDHWRKKIHVACGKLSQPKKIPECLTLTLEIFEWESYKHCIEEEKEVAKYILGNANRLKSATISAKPYGDFNTQEMMVEELESVVRASNSCQLVFETSNETYIRQCKTGVVREDRIGELPDALILQKLSLLPTIDAIATSALSK